MDTRVTPPRLGAKRCNRLTFWHFSINRHGIAVVRDFAIHENNRAMGGLYFETPTRVMAIANWFGLAVMCFFTGVFLRAALGTHNKVGTTHSLLFVLPGFRVLRLNDVVFGCFWAVTSHYHFQFRPRPRIQPVRRDVGGRGGGAHEAWFWPRCWWCSAPFPCSQPTLGAGQ